MTKTFRVHTIMTKNKLATPLYLSILVLSLGALLLSGCNFPAGSSPTPTQGLDSTQAYATALARVTELAALSQTPEPTSSPTPTPTSGSSPTPTLTPQAIQTGTFVGTQVSPTSGVACDQAGPGNPIDITIPDDTRVVPGEKFKKIWRLQNTGSCTWTTNYAVVWFSGEKLGAPEVIPLVGQVAPGQFVDISVDMTAPMQAGTYQSNWKLRNATGQLFAIGPDHNSAFWVRIQVATVTPTPTPQVYASGQVTILPGTTLDLDSLSGAGGDITYQTDENNNHPITPLENVLLGVYGASEPSKSACLAASLGNASIAIEVITPGTYLCFRTGEGRPGWLRIISLNTQDYAMALQVLTWVSP